MIQNGILLTSFPFRRITSCIVGVTGLNQDTKTTELLCGMCCQKKHSKNQNIVKAKAQMKVPWQAFACCHFWLLLGVFPYFLLVTEVTMCKSNLQFIKYLSFLFFFGIYTNHFFFTTSKQFENLTSKNAIHFGGCLWADLNLKTVQAYWHVSCLP